MTTEKYSARRKDGIQVKQTSISSNIYSSITRIIICEEIPPKLETLCTSGIFLVSEIWFETSLAEGSLKTQ